MTNCKYIILQVNNFKNIYKKEYKIVHTTRIVQILAIAVIEDEVQC